MEALGMAAKGKKPALILVCKDRTRRPRWHTWKRRIGRARRHYCDSADRSQVSGRFSRLLRALARSTSRPLFIQTTGGAKGIIPSIELMVELAKEFPNCGYVKEEQTPVIERMRELAKHRPAVKSISAARPQRHAV